jgi:hypothetical protein
MDKASVEFRILTTLVSLARRPQDLEMISEVLSDPIALQRIQIALSALSHSLRAHDPVQHVLEWPSPPDSQAALLAERLEELIRKHGHLSNAQVIAWLSKRKLPIRNRRGRLRDIVASAIEPLSAEGRQGLLRDMLELLNQTGTNRNEIEGWWDEYDKRSK